MDGPEAAVRQTLYEFYSSHGTHPNSKGILFIAPENAVHIGPFADQQRLLGLTGDLTRMSVMAATHLGQWLLRSGIDIVEDEVFEQFDPILVAIKERFLELGTLLEKMRGLADQQAEKDAQAAAAGEPPNDL